MYWHMILTERCNLRCEYCYGKSMKEENNLNERFDYDYDVPCSSGVDVGRLRSFLEKDKNPVLVFYGGEPLMNYSKMKEVIDGLKDISGIRFMMQTNGRLLDQVDDEYLMKMDKMLVSIDGTRERTDANRGVGGYEIVLKNLRAIREKGYRGEIVARMTISYSDIFEQVSHLVGLVDEGIFDSIHWQLDAGFYAHDFDKEKFSKFVDEYNSGIKKLVDYWVGEMRKGRVLRIYPFLGIFYDLYFGKKTRLRCGSGYANYTIATNGKIVACPIMNGMRDFCAGDLDSSLKDLKDFSVGGLCENCDYLDLCGGRCLYANKTRLWPVEGEKLICDTIKFLIDCLREKVSVVRDLVSKGKVSEKDFEYEKYFGPEIIP